MRFVLTYLRFHRNSVTSAALLLLIVCGIALGFLLRPRDAETTTRLGDVHAAPPGATPATVRRPAVVATPAVRPVLSDVQAPFEQRQDAAAALMPATHLQAPVLAALNCARTEATRPALALDSRLSDDAAALGRALAAQPDRPLNELGADAYALVAVMPLRADALVAAAPVDSDASIESTTDVADAAVVASPCQLGDLDPAQLGFPPTASAVGIAVFLDSNPDDGWDTTTAILLAQ